MRAGNLAGQGRPIFDPLSRVFETDSRGNERAIAADRFPNDVIPRHRFSPVALKLLEFYPTATRPGDDIFNNFRWQAFNRRHFEQFLQAYRLPTEQPFQLVRPLQLGKRTPREIGRGAFPQPDGRHPNPRLPGHDLQHAHLESHDAE